MGADCAVAGSWVAVGGNLRGLGKYTISGNVISIFISGKECNKRTLELD